MKYRLRIAMLSGLLAVALVACGGSVVPAQPDEPTSGGSVQEESVESAPAPEPTLPSEPTTEPTMASAPTEVVVEPTATEAEEEVVAEVEEEEATAVAVPEPTAPATLEEAAPTEAPVAANLPLYLASDLTDVNSGATFRVADLTAAGNYVLLETMAVWCSNCRQQQEQVKAYEATAPEGIVSLALDIDLNESPDLLREHAAQGGFDWYYAIATPEVAQAINADFGPQFLTPPSVPMLLVRPDNSIVQLPFGIKSAEQLAALVEENRLN